MEQVVLRYSRKAELAGQLNSDLSTSAAVLRGILMQAMLGNQTSIASLKKQSAALRSRLNQGLRNVEPLMDDQRERETLAALRHQFSRLCSSSDRMLAALDAQQMDVALRIQTEDLLPAQEKSILQVQDFSTMQHDRLASAASAASASVTTGKTLVTIFVILAIGGVAAAIWVGQRATGAFRSMAAELATDASRVADVSHQVSSASRELAEGASQQAASLEQTSASMEEINAMIQKNADNSRRASEYAALAGSTLLEVNAKFKTMTAVMNEINASSEKISKIIKVIDEIAFQTNILALNAAVEAARAGDAGLSFAVVAEAVRDLAQRSAQAARDTAELIEESIRTSREGKTQTGLMDTAIQEVTEHAQQANALSNEVNLGSSDQAFRIEQIASAVRQMQQLTQRTAGHAESTAAAGSEMSSVSVNLRTSANKFQAMVGTAQP
jgi:methyl-accepting chemotaxis protein/methyl-accepting chemotaxis protein-1 (serine sensor receptor)